MKTAITRMGLIMTMGMAVGCSKHDFGTIPTSEMVVQESEWNAKVDFLILVDNSPSMLVYQTRLANEIPAMVDALEEAGIDAHFAVITTTMNNSAGGRFVGNPRFLTSQSENLVESLQARINLGETGSNLERGFEAILESLSPSYLSGEGAGFLRDEALLSLILLTNENDYSNISPASVGAFLDELKPPIQAQRTTYRNWVANHLGVLDLEGSCKSNAEFTEPSEEFMALSDLSGGIKASICDTSFGDAVSNIKKRLIEVLTDFPLPRQPIEDSIRVFVNGVEVPKDDVNGWSYIKDQNLIRFNGDALPNPDANIAIDFTPAGGV